MLEGLQAKIKAHRQGQILCLMDQDGTTADFHDEPMKAFVREKLVELIQNTYQCPLPSRKTIYAIVTGRPFGEAKVLNRLPGGQLLFDQVAINGVFNHGQEMYIDGQLVKREGFSYTDEQQAFIEDKLRVAQESMRRFFGEKLNPRGYTLSEEGRGNIFIAKPGEGKEIKFQLIEAKYLSDGHLSSFALHSRFLTEEKDLAVAFKAVVHEFRLQHIDIVKNQGLVTPKNKELFEKLKSEGSLFFHLPEKQTSEYVDEVAGPYSKAHTVDLFIKELKSRGCQPGFILSAGDSAAKGGTDRGMLEYVAKLNGTDGLETAIVQVRHVGKIGDFLTGQDNMHELQLREPKKVTEMDNFLLGCNLAPMPVVSVAPHATLFERVSAASADAAGAVAAFNPR